MKPLILVTNDDGIHAPGIRKLIELVRPMGDLIVVAPDRPQSGMGHAITINSTLRILKHKEEEGYIEYSCSGTPVDCVKFGVNQLADRPVDLLVSGINHGKNSSINVIYSGTMSAAVEGAIEGIPSIGFSLCDHSLEADFTPTEEYVSFLAAKVLKEGLPKGTCLNVNFPLVPKEELKGFRVARQAQAYWEEKFDERLDPNGQKYYWLTGNFIDQDHESDTDEYALENNYVSVVPVKHDLTDYGFLKNLENWQLEEK